MKVRGRGRILVTGSIAGSCRAAFRAVYNGTKAFIDNCAMALRDELTDTGVTVSWLMPGVTYTHFYERAGMEDTKAGASDDKMDSGRGAKIGFEAMMDGKADWLQAGRTRRRSRWRICAGRTPCGAAS